MVLFGIMEESEVLVKCPAFYFFTTFVVMVIAPYGVMAVEIAYNQMWFVTCSEILVSRPGEGGWRWFIN